MLTGNEKALTHYGLALSIRVVLPGLEPGNAAPKTVVLPLHYRTILVIQARLGLKCGAKLVKKV